MSDQVLRRQVQQLEERLARLEATLRNQRASPQPQFHPCVIKVVNRVSSGGTASANKYEVVILSGNSSAKFSSDLAMPEGMFVPSTDTPGLGIDVAANGLPKHQIGTSRFPQYRLGVVIGRLAEEKGRNEAGAPIVAFSNTDQGVFLVSLSKDGGTDGDGNSTPSYTYTVTRDGTQLGTAVSPLEGRTEGSFDEATRGLGCFDGGAFSLLLAFETPNTFEQDCEETP